jgi:hypothetical protein
LDVTLYSWKVIQPIQVPESVGKSRNYVEGTANELEPIGLDKAPQREGNGQTFTPAAFHQEKGVTRTGG